MKKSTYNKWKYSILEDFIKELEQRAKYAKESADGALERSENEETGEIDTNSWYYSDYVENCEKEEAIRKFMRGD